MCTFPRARAPLCFFVRASASTQAAKLFALWPLPLFRPLGPSIFDFRTFLPPPPHLANILLHHKLHATLHVLWLKRTSSKAVLFEGRHSSTKRALKRPQKAAALPPSRWHRSSPSARARSLARSFIVCEIEGCRGIMRFANG